MTKKNVLFSPWRSPPPPPPTSSFLVKSSGHHLEHRGILCSHARLIYLPLLPHTTGFSRFLLLLSVGFLKAQPLRIRGAFQQDVCSVREEPHWLQPRINRSRLTSKKKPGWLADFKSKNPGGVGGIILSNCLWEKLILLFFILLAAVIMRCHSLSSTFKLVKTQKYTSSE